MSDIFDHRLDAFESMENDSPSYYAPFYKTCKFCGEGGLRWRFVGEKWKLYSESTPHTCNREA